MDCKAWHRESFRKMIPWVGLRSRVSWMKPEVPTLGREVDLERVSERPKHRSRGCLEGGEWFQSTSVPVLFLFPGSC